ncbi:host-nuclease inhibitor Gam family protein [Shouchella lehensis]|uniref:Uncharacterized protein n=1 Tax=Shouchella lehensis G1 TaxID=1246626 RepID=A0A060M063_9BACI|nr:host-nuclease inhibitor Gam family protein [Shouchella lehensis]AIC95410.1 hypothetical protein BleG1_2846 [Shouchella lehensis G1]
MNALQQAEIEELEGEELSEEKFRITNQETLNWTFRKIAVFKERMEETDEIAAKEIERIHLWAAEQHKPIKQSIDFFEGQIMQYHMEMLEKDPKAKTLKTPHGKSKSTTRKPTPVALDKEMLLKHVKESEQTGFISEEIKWGEFKKSLKVQEMDGHTVIIDAYGQRVDGVGMDQGGTTFKVEV